MLRMRNRIHALGTIIEDFNTSKLLRLIDVRDAVLRLV